MNLRRLASPAAAAFLAFLFAFQARGQNKSSQAASRDKGDVYFGYSYVGENLYGDGTSGMNGWQAAAHFRLFPLVGVEGDFAHYSASQDGFSEQVTTVMFGPRLTAPAGALRFFVHALGGLAHQNANRTTYPYFDYDALSYAFGGGVDIPVFREFKFRATGDYMGNSKAPTEFPLHLRMGAGLAYHF